MDREKRCGQTRAGEEGCGEREEERERGRWKRRSILRKVLGSNKTIDNQTGRTV
jgi:hypothetical protein